LLKAYRLKRLLGAEKVVIEFQQEFLSQVEAECQELIKLNWDETGTSQIKLDPDWDAYYELESLGKFKVFTARSSNKLVGYFAVFIGINPHYKDHTFAVNDTIFLHKDYRKGLTAVKLIKFAESCLKEDGVSVLHMHTKVDQPLDPILERLGFGLIEKVYSKHLGEDKWQKQ